MALIPDERWLGAVPSPEDPRDWKASDHIDLAAPLPSRFRLNLLGPVLNQGATGRCVAFSGTGLRQRDERAGGDWPVGWPPLDPQWLYDHAQAIDGLPDGLQTGTTIRAALRVLHDQGQALMAQPATASHFKIASYHAVPFDPGAIRAAIRDLGPVWVGTRWYSPWFRPVAGLMPPPSGSPVGGHAVWLFGWDDTVGGGSYLVRNSWGKGWGTNGNVYFPYRYLTPNLHDAWTTADVPGDAHYGG